jgi:NAD(P) transhydrogenase subunit alpha
VEASDVRPAVREEVQSLGADFVELEVGESEGVGEGGYAKELTESKQEQERQIIARRLARTDCVISTAMIPGKVAPTLITKEMVESMRPGSLIIDLAAEQGGNCELTQPGKKIKHRGVTIHGPIHLVVSMPTHASQMYSKNLYAFLMHFLQDGRLNFDFDDEITRSTCITQGKSAAKDTETVSETS